MPETAQLFRAAIFHTPANPFHDDHAMQVFMEGGLLVQDGRVRALGEYAQIRSEHPNALVEDYRGGYILPGFIDAHTHFPQVRVLGGLGYTLLDWLAHRALPEEARMADSVYAGQIAGEFVRALVSHGTTTALVFGAHFPEATALLFETAAAAGIRCFSGLVVSDRMLRPELHQTPENAYRESKELIARYHGRDRLGYAVTPRFALSASEGMLEVCGALLKENPGLLMQTHLNENDREIREVAALFPWAKDYLSVYERFGLAGAGSVFAHNVHPAAGELTRLAACGASVAYCPCSNAALGSGFFPMRQHMDAGVRFAMGTDVGGGLGFGLMKEALQGYLLQRLCAEGFTMQPAHMLYLITRAGAEVLGVGGETGDLAPGKSADFVYLRPFTGSPLENVVTQAASADRVLAALFALASQDTIREVRISGQVVYSTGRTH